MKILPFLLLGVCVLAGCNNGGDPGPTNQTPAGLQGSDFLPLDNNQLINFRCQWQKIGYDTLGNLVRREDVDNVGTAVIGFQETRFGNTVFPISVIDFNQNRVHNGAPVA
jgi:hypothetical protein